MVESVIWEPGQYLSFDRERLQPALDLIGRIPLQSAQTIVDLGCGPGNITKILKQRWMDAEIIGYDNSEEMLEKASGLYPEISWQHSDLNKWSIDKKVDLLFSNAAFHWIDDHQNFFPKVIDYVKPGGYFAVQMPRNWAAPSHATIHETVAEGPWKDLLEPVIILEPSFSPETYYRILRPFVTHIEIWETEYIQVLEGENPVADYVKGSWLQRFLQVLEEPYRSEFETAYREKIMNAYPKQPDGKTLFPFKRLFLLARI